MEIISLDALVNALDARAIRDIRITPANNRIRYRRYVHADGTEILLLVNEGTAVYEGSITFPFLGEKALYAYDAWNNALTGAKRNGDTVSFRLEPLHSLTLVLDPNAESHELPTLPSDAEMNKEAENLPFSGPWQREICRSIDYPAFSETREVLLPDHLAEELPKFSGFVRYRNSFEAREGDRLTLEITDAHEGVELFVNGKSLGIQIVPPFRYELTGALRDGRNELSVEVATTLERENSGIPDVTGQIKEPTSLSGITGNVILRGE